MSNVPTLLAMEISRILEDLEDRRELLVKLWSMHRSRWPQAEASFSRWRTLRQRELDALAPDVVIQVDLFYAALEDWMHYLKTTEDMPLHLDWNWRQHYARLHVTGHEALDALGPPPPVEVPEVDRDGRSFLEGFALVAATGRFDLSPRQALSSVEEE